MQAVGDLRSAGRNLLKVTLQAETKFESLLEQSQPGLRDQWARIASDAVKLAGQIENIEWRLRQEVNRA